MKAGAVRSGLAIFALALTVCPLARAGEHVTLREVRSTDASALMAMLTTEEVAEFVSPLPLKTWKVRTT